MAPISSKLIAAVCLAAALFAPVATALAAPPSTVRLQVNGQALPFPVPQGYVDAASLSPDLQRMGEAMTGPSNRLLAFWVDPAEVRAMSAGQAEGLKRYFMLQVHRRREGMVLSAADFQGVRNAVIGDQATFMQQLRQQMPKVADSVSQQVQRATGDSKVQLKVGELQPLGVVFDEPQAFAYLMRTVFDVGDGRPMPMLLGTVMVRHQDRLVGLGAYAVDDGPHAEAWVRQSTKAWARALALVR